VCEEAGLTGKAFIDAMGGTCRVSEHRMRLERARRPELEGARRTVRLCWIGTEELGLFTRLVARAFGDAEKELRQRLSAWAQEPGQQFYVGLVGEKPIGTIRVSPFEGRIFLTSFGVLPACRGRGYGRQILTEAIDTLLPDDWKEIFIEVETTNASAITLYKSCGFETTRTYSFYEM
jgi:ribosomal protein S18 acetylase RimI-like enzyme